MMKFTPATSFSRSSENAAASAFYNTGRASSSSELNYGNLQTASNNDVFGAKGGRSKVMQRRRFYKTRLCPYHFKKGSSCKGGANCSYAHSFQELRPSVDLTKTKVCNDFINGQCFKPVNECPFAHGSGDLRAMKGFPGTESSRLYYQQNNQWDDAVVAAKCLDNDSSSSSQHHHPPPIRRRGPSDPMGSLAHLNDDCGYHGGKTESSLPIRAATFDASNWATENVAMARCLLSGGSADMNIYEKVRDQMTSNGSDGYTRYSSSKVDECAPTDGTDIYGYSYGQLMSTDTLEDLSPLPNNADIYPQSFIPTRSTAESSTSSEPKVQVTLTQLANIVMAARSGEDLNSLLSAILIDVVSPELPATVATPPAEDNDSIAGNTELLH